MHLRNAVLPGDVVPLPKHFYTAEITSTSEEYYRQHTLKKDSNESGRVVENFAVHKPRVESPHDRVPSWTTANDSLTHLFLGQQRIGYLRVQEGE